ncbi:MAG: polysaccharide biosynthesis tyrosine autokinase [Fluviibacter sp.]
MNQNDNDIQLEEPRKGWFKPAEIFENVIYYRWVFVTLFVLVFSIGAIITLLKTPIYKADVLIQVESQKGNAVGSAFSGGGGGAGGGSFDLMSQSPIPGQIEIFKSRNVIGRAVETEFLHTSVTIKNRPPIVGGFPGRFLDKDEDGLTIPPFSAIPYAWGGEKLVFDRFVVPARYQTKPLTLTVGADKDWVITDETGTSLVRGHNGDLVEAEEGRWQIKTRTLIANPGTEFTLVRYPLQSRIGHIAAGLKVTERGRGTSLLEATFESPSPDFAMRMVNAISDAYVMQNIERKSEEAEKTLKFLETLLPDLKTKADKSAQDFARYQEQTGRLDPKSEVEGLVAQSVGMEKERLTLEIKRRELMQRYAPAHPAIRAIDASLAELKSQYQDTADQIKALPADQLVYFRNTQNVELDNKLYSGLIEYAQKLELVKAGTVGNVSIIDRAVLPVGPSYPNKIKELSIAGLLGLILGILGAHLFGRMLGNVRDPKRLEDALGTRMFAILPLAAEQIGTATDKVFMLAKEKPNSTSVESLRSLRVAMQFSLLEKKRQKVILITSAVPGQGKSFIASNLAFLLAASGKKTLLIDADIRKTSLHRYFPINRKGHGLSEVLQDKYDLESLLIPGIYPNLDMIPAGRPASNPGELFVEGKLEQIIQWAADNYDIVLVDSPPVLPVNDSVVLSRLCDVTVFVVRQEKVSLHEIEEAYELFNKAGVSPDGMVFNSFVPSRVRYGVSKYGYYAYKYGYGRYGRYGRYGHYGADAYGYGLDPDAAGHDKQQPGFGTVLIRSQTFIKQLSRVLQKQLTRLLSRFRR